MDPGIDRVIEEGVAWLGRAQAQSVTQDGGVARHYSLLTGWGSSYPETTGYIIPTLFNDAKRQGNTEARQQAVRMLDWLVRIQFHDGGFQGGCVDSVPVVPATFNTGQILLGLAAGTMELGRYEAAMRRAADWLVRTQDPDGAWRKHPSSFATPGEKAYETHVAWGLLEAARLEPNRGYAEAALANVCWALTKQQENGWVRDCCIFDSKQPLTHTLGYFLRGVIEAYRYSNDNEFLNAAKLTADPLLGALRNDGHLAGRFAPDWRPAVDWVCLTGSAQVALCWLMLYRFTNDTRYRDAGFLANKYVRRTVKADGPPETRGAVKGAFPINGRYGRYQYLNWAVKFCVDSNVLEREMRAS